MKIEEAKEEVNDLSFCGKHPSVIKERVNRIIDQIELDQPKPVVPQMIFDIIKKFKGENRSFHSLLENISAVKEAWEWLNMPKPGIKESELMQAWLEYPNITVEKDKLYTVEIPNPNSGRNNVTILTKNYENKVIIVCHIKDNWKNSSHNQLTEQEIRKDFDWAFRWAEEVTE